MALEHTNLRSVYSQFLQRDGSSQAKRLQTALQPDYITIDERSLKDLLAFAQKYAKELQYFEVKEGEVQATADWQNFLNDEIDLDDVVAFIQNPAEFPPEKAQMFTRPHFALFLTFLKLMSLTQEQLNTLTERHLAFYYQTVLQMQKQHAVPDQVNVLVDIAPDTQQFELPAGTLLMAGTNSLGQDLAYRTNQDIVLSHAQVAQLSSLFSEKQIMGIPEARETHTGTKVESIIKMMEMAFGVPHPSDPMPLFPNPNGVAVDYDLLQTLLVRVRFLDQALFLRFDELHQLMTLKARRDNATAEWTQINTILEQAGKTRTENSSYQLAPQDPEDFDTNLRTAVGDPAHFYRLFDGIPEVKTIYDAYNKRNRTDLKDDIENRVQEHLYLPVAATNNLDFTTLMQTKIRIDNEWNEINRLLAVAGQRKGLLRPDTEFPRPLLFAIEDIRDWPSFLHQLASENHPTPTTPRPSNRIWDNFHADIQQTIIELTTPNEIVLEIDEKIIILDALNNILYQRDFYQDTHFSDLPFTQEIQALLSQDIQTLSSTEIQQFNRLLIQTAFADKIESGTLPLTSPADFEANFHIALGSVDFPEQLATLDNYYQALLEVSTFFFMPVGDFAYLMQTAENEIDLTDDNSPTQQDWAIVYNLLAEAHQEKTFADRRTALQAIHEAESLDAMLMLALGETSATADNLLSSLLEFTNPNDEEFLQDVWQRAEAEQLVSASEWQRVYQIVELIQRAQLPLPIAQKETWLNLYAAADATAVTKQGTDTTSWHTFGHAPTSPNTQSTKPADIGWAVSSPLLALSEGERTVQLTLGFDMQQVDTPAIQALFAETSPIQIEITTEEGWIEPKNIQVVINDYAALTDSSLEGDDVLLAIQFQLQFPPNVAAIAPLAEATSRWPQLRLKLRQLDDLIPERSGSFTHYKSFKELELRQVHLQVDAIGVTPTQLQNDETTLNAKKPFEPFGSQALAGSRFLLGHPELAIKRLDHVTFNVQWMGVPANLASHYASYEAGIQSNSALTTRLSLVDNRLSLPLVADGDSADYPLFANGQANEPHTLSIPDVPRAVANGRSGYHYQHAPELITNDDLLNWSRYFLWELNDPDFQHDRYPSLAIEKSVALAAAVSAQTINNGDIASFQVNPPYTPKMKRLSFDYRASTTINMASYKPENQIDQLFYIQPFGTTEIQTYKGTNGYRFLPQFDFEGELYIGIENAEPPQNLSLLFQMAEGSADPDLEPVSIQWSYLDNNQWLNLDDGNILEDTTRGLIHSGIIKFKLEPTRPSTLLSPNYYWLRAAVPHHSRSLCDTVAIHTQAVSATFINDENTTELVHQPLAADSISELVEPLSDITGIRQPYTSYGGKMAEQDATFYTRISERLRHKQRALTIWDYEHLILENFPEIYKVKCLPASPQNLGVVQIVVIPNIQNKIPFNPFEPKVPTNLLADIEAFLADKIPPFASVKVKNATFVPVQVRFGVRFRQGYNEGFYKQQLNEEINRFLSPWAYEEGADIVIGGRIYANVLINFIEERPYVDFVAQMKLFSSEDGQTFKLAFPSESDGYWIETDRLDGVLVAAQQHTIDILTDTDYEEDSFAGIGHMKIELDFVVG